MKLLQKIGVSLMSVALAVPLAISSGTVMAADTADYQLDVNTTQRGATISPYLNGTFLEDINYAGDGGLYAELVENRSFEFLSAVGSTANANPAPLFAWKLVQTGGGAGTIAALKENPLNANNPTYLQLNVTAAGDGVGFSNDGYDGMAIKSGDSYDFSMYVRSGSALSEPITISVMNPNGTQSYGQAQIEGSAVDSKWKKLTATIQATGTATNAKLFITTKNIGKIDFDMVSLFPQKTWKNRPGGLRADLVQMLADMKPKFLRFPGGAIVGGKNMANAYMWKNTIGDVAERPNNINFWSTANRGEKGAAPTQNQSGGLGYYEYFLLAEDLGAEPLPVVNVGMVEQFLVGGPNTPLSQIQPFIQDALDLIEYANGDITTEWGAKRAAAGHPEPFNLKYMSLGNEHWGQDYYDRYPLFYDAIKAKYPYMNLIFSTGGSADVAAGWNWINDPGKGKGRAEVMDEHYYTNASWMLNNTNRYDSYDRDSKQVFVGEFAVKNDAGSANNGDGNTGNSMKGALAEAAYMTGLERNGDVVRFASYAPTFAKLGSAGGNTYTQWWPDLIFFNNTQVYGTTSYQVQKLFSSNTSKSSYVMPSALTKTNSSAPQGVYSVASKDLTTGDIVVKLVNNSNTALSTRIHLNGMDADRLGAEGTAIELAANALTDENSLANPTKVAPQTKPLTNIAPQFDYTLPKYSVTVFRIPTTGEDPLDIQSIPALSLDTAVNHAPKLPTMVTANLKNGGTTKVTVSWEPVPLSEFATIGNVFTVKGVASSTSQAVTATVTVIATPTIASIEAVNVTTRETVAPFLPNTVKAVFSDRSIDYLQVTRWDPIEPSKYAKPGTFTVEGTVAGTELKAVANVTVTPGPALGTDLMLWYKFNEGSGTAITDSSGKGNNGTLLSTAGGSAAWLTDGHEGGSINLNGGKVNAGNSQSLQPKDITVSFWFKRTASISGEQVVAWFKPNGNYASNGWFITFNGAIIMMIDGTNLFKVAQTPNNFFPLNEWTHVAFTFNSVTKQGKIYKNGVEQTVVVEGALNSITATNDPKLIGVSGYSDGAPLKGGSLDDFQIYNIDKSPLEIQTIYKGKQIISLQDVHATTEAGTAPVLPGEVMAEYNDSTAASLPVAWNPVNESQYAQAGAFVVEGAVAGTDLKAKAYVTVTAVKQPQAVLTGPEFIEAGGAFELAYRLADVESEVFAQDITIAYNDSKLEFVSAKSADSEALVIAGMKESAGQVRIVSACLGEKQPDPDRDLIILAFKAKSDAEGIGQISASPVIVSNGEGGETEIGGAFYSVMINTVDKQALLALIDEAKGAHDSAVEGDKAGQYPSGSKAVLQAAIDAARAVAGLPSATQAQIEQAAADLTGALNAFRASVIKPIPGDVNQDNRVSVGDLAIVAKAYGKTSHDADWETFRAYDFIEDGIIDIEDLAWLARLILNS